MSSFLNPPLCPTPHSSNPPPASSSSTTLITLSFKHSKQKHTLLDLSPSTTIPELKVLILSLTNVPIERQKLLGLNSKTTNKPISDPETIGDLKGLKRKKEGSSSSTSCSSSSAPPPPTNLQQDFILMGTPSEVAILIDPLDHPMASTIALSVIDDFDLSHNAGSPEWIRSVSNSQNLLKFTDSTEIHLMNDFRSEVAGGRPRPLLVLDLDHTLLDFSSKAISESSGQTPANSEAAEKLKRPYMDIFLTNAYENYDLAIWSQTSWRWLEIKLIELNMIHNPGYKIAFVMDKTSMFRVISDKDAGKGGKHVDDDSYEHSVKPLQIIWSKFPTRFGRKNTIAVDDLKRNFALNPTNGITCSAFYRNKSSARKGTGKNDVELLGIGAYLQKLKDVDDFSEVDHEPWRGVVEGKFGVGVKYFEEEKGGGGKKG